jgi:hypothetical protein
MGDTADPQISNSRFGVLPPDKATDKADFRCNICSLQVANSAANACAKSSGVGNTEMVFISSKQLKMN